MQPKASLCVSKCVCVIYAPLLCGEVFFPLTKIIVAGLYSVSRVPVKTVASSLCVSVITLSV